MEFSSLQLILVGLIGLLNLYTFVLFYTDKKRAVKGQPNRISENKLLLSSFLTGGIGGLLGMFIIRHKTKHTRFKVLIPIAALLTIFVLYIVWRL